MRERGGERSQMKQTLLRCPPFFHIQEGPCRAGLERGSIVINNNNKTKTKKNNKKTQQKTNNPTDNNSSMKAALFLGII